MTEFEQKNPQEIKFAPQSGDVIVRSANDLMTAGIIIPVSQVEQRWGSDQAETYRSWQIKKNKTKFAKSGDIFQS